MYILTDRSNYVGFHPMRHDYEPMAFMKYAVIFETLRDIQLFKNNYLQFENYQIATAPEVLHGNKKYIV